MRRILCAVACFILLISAAMAQSDRGNITGTITDPTGAMIPNASIEAKNTQTGVAYQAASSETGNYTLAQLPVGMYQLTVNREWIQAIHPDRYHGLDGANPARRYQARSGKHSGSRHCQCRRSAC